MQNGLRTKQTFLVVHWVLIVVHPKYDTFFPVQNNNKLSDHDSFNLYIFNSYAYLVWHMQLSWEAEDKYNWDLRYV